VSSSSAGGMSGSTLGVAGSGAKPPSAPGATSVSSAQLAGSGGAASAATTSGGVAGHAAGGSASTSACSGSQRETCDGLDNDCDGQIDEDLSQQCGSSNMGDCRYGMQVCMNGTWGACEGAVEPMAEVCDADGHDENCDGVANEMCDCTPQDTRPCGQNQGTCKPGMQSCSDSGHWSTECVGATGPQKELCDSNDLDEDCDGNPSNGCECTNGKVEMCSTGKLGVCAAGMRTCSNGQWSSCVPLKTPQREICDTRADEDCDGDPLSGCECTIGATQSCTTPGDCSSGTKTCGNNGTWGACTSKKCSTSQYCATGACRPLPAGSYQGTCNDCTVSGNTLMCSKCAGGAGGSTRLDMNTCEGGVSNCSGVLTCDRDTAHLPSGSYTSSCSNCRVEYCGTKLICDSCTGANATGPLTIPCPNNGGPWNDDGVLKCP
jgi:hypothetical protein